MFCRTVSGSLLRPLGSSLSTLPVLKLPLSSPKRIDGQSWLKRRDPHGVGGQGVLGNICYLAQVCLHGEGGADQLSKHFSISELRWVTQFSVGGDKDLHRWYPLDLYTPLSTTPVPWQELLHAASIYKVDALRARCEAALSGITI